MKPMLAHNKPVHDKLDQLPFPMIGQPKWDGVRILTPPKGAVTRKLKPPKCKYIAKLLSNPKLRYLDGEVITLDEDGKINELGRVTGDLNTIDFTGTFIYHVFDSIKDPDAPYRLRYIAASRIVAAAGLPFVQMTEWRTLRTPHLALEYEADVLARGWRCDGIILKRANGHYKYGRSTFNEALSLKVKRFHDAEATIVGMVERMHNANPPTTNALGKTERSSHKENLIPRGDMGALVLKMKNGDTFECGNGFTDEDRAWFWKHRERLIKKRQLVTYKYQRIGAQGKPLLPTYRSLRNKGE